MEEAKVIMEPPKMYTPAGSTLALVQKSKVAEPEIENFCVRFDPEDKYFAVGSSDNTVRVYNAVTGKLVSSMSTPPPATKMPVTSLKWKPLRTDGKPTSLLASVTADGYITYWHATTGKCLISMRDPNETDLYTIDFKKDGSMFAVGGKDFEVKIYDDSTKSQVSTLKAAGTVNLGHSNRVFCVHFTDDPNILVSGGWDSTIFFWDLRESRSIGFVYGPHICGDSIDVKGDVMLTGSYSSKEVLQLWSVGERRLIETVKWETGSEYEHAYLYSALFDKVRKGKYIAAGGAGRNEMKIFRNAKDYDLLSRVTFNKTVTSIDFANSSDMLAVACGDGTAYTYVLDDINKH